MMCIAKKKDLKKNLSHGPKINLSIKNIFTDWDKAYEAWRPYAKHRMYINEGIIGSPIDCLCRLT